MILGMLVRALGALLLCVPLAYVAYLFVSVVFLGAVEPCLWCQ